jgi:hypothetical protein
MLQTTHRILNFVQHIFLFLFHFLNINTFFNSYAAFKYPPIITSYFDISSKKILFSLALITKW